MPVKVTGPPPNAALFLYCPPAKRSTTADQAPCLPTVLRGAVATDSIITPINCFAAYPTACQVLVHDQLNVCQSYRRRYLSVMPRLVTKGVWLYRISCLSKRRPRFVHCTRGVRLNLLIHYADDTAILADSAEQSCSS
jgi:hypothetical protein